MAFSSHDRTPCPLLNLLVSLSLVGLLFVAGFILRFFWSNRREGSYAKEAISPERTVLSEQQQPEEYIPASELPAAEPPPTDSIDVEPPRTESSESITSVESELPRPVDTLIDIESQEPKPGEPGVIGDYDLQSSATAEHLSDADLHKSTLSEPDTALEELDLLPTDSIEQETISETIVNSKQACTPAVDRSIDAESVDK